MTAPFRHRLACVLFAIALTAARGGHAMNCDIASDGGLPPTLTDVQALADIVVGSAAATPCDNGECEFDTSRTGTPDAGDVAALLAIVSDGTAACQPVTAAAPVFTSTNSTSAIIGQPFSFSVTITDSDTQQGGLTLSTTSKPDWITLNGFELSGTPTLTGSQTVDLSVTDGTNTVTQSLTIHVQDPPPMPLATLFGAYGNQVTVSDGGMFWILTSGGQPDHNSPYYPQGNPKHEAYNGNNLNFQQNPNTITAQNLELRVPKVPMPAQTKTSTSLGPMGISVNGIALYNQFAGPSQPLTSEIDSFDQYNGHPQQQGQYHYHIEPLYLTDAARQTQSGFLGVLLDGFPVYGPVENGSTITNNDLDEYHGHHGPTAEFPGGIYHYHITATDPYINGGQFFGVPGTTTQ